MKKVVMALAVGMLLLTSGWAQADDLNLGGLYRTGIYMTDSAGTPVADELGSYNLGGGSIDISYLNGQQLDFTYCLQYSTVVYVPGDYAQSLVNNQGIIDGSTPVNNAAQVAWLLTNYGQAGQGDAQAALQAAIWHETSGLELDTGVYASGSTIVADYTQDLTNVGVGIVSNYDWMTPQSGTTQYQALVAPVPEPSVLLFLGVSLVSAGAVARRRLRKI